MTWQEILTIVIQCLCAVIPVISVVLHSYGIHVFCKHGLQNNQSEVNTMEYRSGNDYSAKTDGQKFSPLKKEYELNERTNELEETGEMIDVQKEINSHLETCLEKILQRILNPDPDYKPEYGERGQLRDKLDELRDSIEASYDTAEYLRRQLNLSEDLDPTEIFDKSLMILEAQERAEKIQKNKQSEVKKEDEKTSNETAQ